MKRIGDFTFGVIYSGKEKVERKVRKWTGIAKDPSQRQRWEERLIEQGRLYRQELMEHLRMKILGSGLAPSTAMNAKPKKQDRVQLGQKVHFHALNKGEVIEGVVSATNFDPTGEFFLVKTVDEFGSFQTYICRDCGDSYIGDTEF